MITTWLSLLISSYIFYQIYLHSNYKHIDMCLEYGICEKPKKDLTWYAINKLILTENEETLVISKYANIEKNITSRPDCTIGVGYTSCVDVGF